MKKKIIIVIGCLLLVLVSFSLVYIFSFKLIGDKQIEVLYKDNYKDLGYQVFLNLNKLVETENNVDTNKIGTYHVIYKIPFKTLVREVKVVDKEKNDLELNVGKEYIESGFVVNDNVNLNLTDKVEIDKNIDTNKLINKVKDSSSNEKDINKNVKVVDKIAPIITLKGSKKVVIKVNDTYQEDGYKAIDNIDGDITKLVKVEKNVNYNKVGTYYIKYSCLDSSLNYNEVKRIIEVVEKIDNSTREETKDYEPTKVSTNYNQDIDILTNDLNTIKEFVEKNKKNHNIMVNKEGYTIRYSQGENRPWTKVAWVSSDGKESLYLRDNGCLIMSLATALTSTLTKSNDSPVLVTPFQVMNGLYYYCQNHNIKLSKIITQNGFTGNKEPLMSALKEVWGVNVEYNKKISSKVAIYGLSKSNASLVFRCPSSSGSGGHIATATSVTSKGFIIADTYQSRESYMKGTTDFNNTGYSFLITK